jgi:ASC-1-like (ASCH) protein
MREGSNNFSGAITLITTIATIGGGILAYIKLSDYFEEKEKKEEIKKKVDQMKSTAKTGDTIQFTGQNGYGKVVTVRVLDTVRTLKGELAKPSILVDDAAVMKELLGYPYKYLKYLRQFFLYSTAQNLNDTLQEKLNKENWSKAKQYLALEPVEKAKKPTATAKATTGLKSLVKK